MAMAIMKIQRDNIEVNTCWILSRDLAFISGKMARSMRGIGKKASNMALAVLPTQRAKTNAASGSTAK